jgi:hypothetical protein
MSRRHSVTSVGLILGLSSSCSYVSIGEELSSEMRGAGFVQCSSEVVSLFSAFPGIEATTCLTSTASGFTLVGAEVMRGPISGFYRPFLVRDGGAPPERIGKRDYRVSFDAKWNPPGSKVAWTGTIGLPNPSEFSNDQVFVLDVATMTVTECPKFTGAAFQLSWAPDSSALAVVVAASDESIGDRPHGDLFLLDLHKQKSLRLSEGRLMISPVWSPDGTSLVAADEERPVIVCFDRDGRPLGESEVAVEQGPAPQQIQELSWTSREGLAVRFADFDGEKLLNSRWVRIGAAAVPCR